MCRCCCQIIFGTFGGIACDVLIVIEVGGDGDVDGGFVGSFHGKHTVGTRHPAAGVPGGQSSLKLHLAFQTFVQGRYAGKCYAREEGGGVSDVGGFGSDTRSFGSDDDILMGGGELGVESNPSRTVGGEVYHDYLVGE